jgi:hypothetical protein
MNCDDQKETTIIFGVIIICITITTVICTIREQVGIRRELTKYKARYGEIITHDNQNINLN